MNHFQMLVRLVLVLWVGLASHVSMGDSDIPAFPGAEGFGANTPGGRGGEVIEVTNLNDSGPGSFRDAVERSGKRIVVFRVGGTIDVKSSIDIEDPFITIAGQTAPGGGIALRNDGNTSATLKINTNDVIIRFLRIRPGPGGEADGLALQNGARNIVTDHCSMTWGIDETVSMYTGDVNDKIENVTFQWNIISDALDCSTHGEGCHSKGFLIQYADKISVHHNLMANNGARSPMILSGDIEVSNNVMYNWGGSVVKIENRHGDVFMNFVANYIEPGSDSALDENGIQVKTKGINLYLKDNYASHVRPNNSYPEDTIVNYLDDGEATFVNNRYNYPSIQLSTPAQAYEDVLNGSGATLPSLDRVDGDIISKVRNKTSRIIDDPNDVGGYPSLSAGNAPLDSDSDGMPDDWETARGLNPNSASDGNADRNEDGYTNIEEYLNELVDSDASSPAPEPTISDEYWRIQNASSGDWIRPQNCSDESQTPLSQVSNAYKGDCTMFQFIPTEDAYYFIVNKATGGKYRPLDCSAVSNESVEIVQVSENHNGWCTQWKLNQNEQGQYRLQNRDSGQYIRVNGCSDVDNDSETVRQVSTNYGGSCTLWSLKSTDLPIDKPSV